MHIRGYRFLESYPSIPSKRSTQETRFEFGAGSKCTEEWITGQTRLTVSYTYLLEVVSKTHREGTLETVLRQDHAVTCICEKSLTIGYARCGVDNESGEIVLLLFN